MVGKRRRAREMAMQMLYQRDLGGAELEQIFAGFDLEEYGEEPDDDDASETGETAPPAQTAAQRAAQRAAQKAALADADDSQDDQRLRDAFEYARRLVEGTTHHGEAIDDLIRSHAENWRLERMPVIDRSILRLAIYEMLYESSVPKVVIVDEAIELAKRFGSDQSGRFVNGLLDGVLKSGDVPTG